MAASMKSALVMTVHMFELKVSKTADAESLVKMFTLMILLN